MVLDQRLLVILLCVHPPAALVYWLLCRRKRPATASAEPATPLQRTKDRSALTHPDNPSRRTEQPDRCYVDRWRLRPPAPSCLPARAAGGIEVKRSQGRRAVPVSHCGPRPGRPDAGSAVRKKSAVTNRDKKDSIRGRMADTGESFNVARRKVEAAAAGQVPEGEDPYQLIEVEVGTDAKFPDRPLNPRHIETFRGRWIIAPDPERLYPLPSGSLRSACYGVAQTSQGRIAVYMRVVYRAKDYPSIAEESIAEDAPVWQSIAKDGPVWEGRLFDFDTLPDAHQLPEDIYRQVAPALVIHRDI